MGREQDIRSFKDLKAWQKKVEIVKTTYQITKQLPKNETFVLIKQIHSCSVSIPSNIAEGRERGTRKDFVQFLRIAKVLWRN